MNSKRIMLALAVLFGFNSSSVFAGSELDMCDRGEVRVIVTDLSKDEHRYVLPGSKITAKDMVARGIFPIKIKVINREDSEEGISYSLDPRMIDLEGVYDESQVMAALRQPLNTNQPQVITQVIQQTGPAQVQVETPQSTTKTIVRQGALLGSGLLLALGGIAKIVSGIQLHDNNDDAKPAAVISGLATTVAGVVLACAATTERTKPVVAQSQQMPVYAQPIDDEDEEDEEEVVPTEAPVTEQIQRELRKKVGLFDKVTVAPEQTVEKVIFVDINAYNNLQFSLRLADANKPKNQLQFYLDLMSPGSIAKVDLMGEDEDDE